MVPQTTTWRAHREAKIRDGTATDKPDFYTPAGQTTLDTRRPQSTHADDQTGAPVASSSRQTTNGEPSPVSGGGGLVFQHYEPNGAAKTDEDGDAQMS